LGSPWSLEKEKRLRWEKFVEKEGFKQRLEWKSEWVMDDESGESMEPMEEVPLIGLGDRELERLVRGWRREAESWFQRWGEAYWKEQLW